MVAGWVLQWFIDDGLTMFVNFLFGWWWLSFGVWVVVVGCRLIGRWVFWCVGWRIYFLFFYLGWYLWCTWMMGFSRWWLFDYWFCDGGEMAEEEELLEWGLSNNVGIEVCFDTKLMQDNNWENRDRKNKENNSRNPKYHHLRSVCITTKQD